jgi:hypothetical protein
MVRRTSSLSRFLPGSLLALTLAFAPLTANAQTIDPFYAGSYTLNSLGNAPGVPTPYGGVVVKAGDTNTLLLGGSANNANGVIHNVPVTRDGSNHITAYNGNSSLFATAPNIDGGLAYGPNGVLFATTYNNNNLLQYLPGANTPSKTINLTGLGIASSVGTLQFVPAGVPGAGRFKVASYNGGNIYDVTLIPDGLGTFNIGTVTVGPNLGANQPEGIVYIQAGNPLFPVASMLVSEFSAGRVSSYEIDANGDPILATRRTFISGLSGAEGAAIDPLTGDFIFSTFGGANQVVVVRGFSAPVTAAAPEPATVGFLAATMLPALALRRRRCTG